MAEPAEGQVPAGDFKPVVESESKPEPAPETEVEIDPAVDTVARQVLAGQWGRGQNRNKRLEASGHNVEAVDARIKQIINRR